MTTTKNISTPSRIGVAVSTTVIRARKFHQAVPQNPAVAEYIKDDQLHRRLIAEKLNSVLKGKINVVGQITLTPSRTTTTLTDNRLGGYSWIEFMAITANAATAKASIWCGSFLKGSCVIHHASSANLDQTFNYIVIG